jgi:CP family cyanate transporter-like MFS transporter
MTKVHGVAEPIGHQPTVHQFDNDATASTSLWTAIGIVLVAANLRPAVVAISPLLGQIRDQEGLSATSAGLLTTLPVLCFGLLAPVAPRLSRRWGIERVVFGALVLLGAGFATRLVPAIWALFIGTMLAGVAIAIGNVLLPALIKRDFPHRVGLMTGLYSMALTGGATLAAGLTIPISEVTGLGWRATLACWGGITVLSAVSWLPQLGKRHGRVGAGASRPRTGLRHSALAWSVTLFMGLQSLDFYATAAWLPEIFADQGASTAEAGWRLALASLVSISASLLVPMVASRLRRQRLVGVVATVSTAVAVIGLVVVPSLPYLWVVLLGLAQGSALGLALTLIVLRAGNVRYAAGLSSMAQSVGYVMAAAGPLAVGFVHDRTAGWTVPMLLLAVLLLPQAMAAYRAGRDEQVGEVSATGTG